MVALAELQKAAAITRVVWVDDVFAEPPDESLRVAIQAKLKVLYETDNIPRHNAFSNVNSTAPEAIRNKQIEEVLDGMADDKLPRLLESLTKQSNDCGLYGDPEEDLTPAQVIRLRDGLQNVTVCPYRIWRIERASILADADDKTLFLIDREFVKEGLGDDLGDDIIAEIVARAPKAHCIMFTHKVGPENADGLRAEIGEKVASVEAHQFGVMSKRGLSDGVSDVTLHFSRALRMALLCRFCCDVALETCAVMSAASLDAAHKMAGFSVESIDAAIFENSLREGASEFDVVDRILAVNQRVASQRALAAKSDSFARLQRIRDVRSLERSDANNTTEPQLHEWRIAEVLDEGEYINALHSPLRCGDIFRHVMNQRRYVLLAQPCDLVVRGKRGEDFGKRRREEAELVLIEERDPGEVKRETNFVIGGVGAHGESWVVNFREAFSVNLRVLDLAVYSHDGRVSWQQGQKVPIHLLPGWQERYRLMEETLSSGQDPDAIGPLSLADKDHDLCGNSSDSSYSLPLERTGRIRSPYAEAIQASYATFISRAALSHDFARSLWAEKPESGDV